MQVPRLNHHPQTGQFRAWLVRANGKRGWVYFGADAERAEASYRAALSRFLVADGRAPIRVADIIERVMPLLRAEYRDSADLFRYSLRFLDCTVTVAGQSIYLPSLPADAMTVTHLAAVQRRMIELGKRRGYINATIRRIVRVWERARIEGMVSRETVADLRTLPAIRAGHRQVRDAGPVRSVDDATVEATLRAIPSVMIRDMIRVLRIEGMRVGELCRLTLAMLDDSGPTWRISLGMAHKTAGRTGAKVLRIRPQAQPFLRPWVERARATMQVDAFVFPGQRDHLRPHAVRRAISRACERVGIAPWTTHQLRHARATEVARMKAAAIEAVQAELGHASRSAALGYIDPDVIG